MGTINRGLRRRKLWHLVFVSTLFILLFTASAEAGDIIMGVDAYLTNMFDHRTYHESHPGSAAMASLGGWSIGLGFLESGGDDIEEVHIIADNSVGGAKYTHVQTEPVSYPWIGRYIHDYVAWYGHKTMISNPFEIQAFTKDQDGNLVQLRFGFPPDPMNNHADSLYVFPSITAAAVPVCKIKRLAIKRDGQLKVKFTAPYDTRRNQIRIRVMNAENTGAEEEFIYNPPYQIERRNGAIIPDQMLVLLPGIYTGRIARIEYRVMEDVDYFLSRGITYFKLPSLEE